MTNSTSPTLDYITGFQISKMITDSRLFSACDLTPSAKIVLRCLTDFWNYKLCYSYPTQVTICDCTGLSRSSVVNSIEELLEKNIIIRWVKNKRCYYTFTYKFWTYLKSKCPKFRPDMYKICTNICTKFGHNKNIKEKENSFFSNSLLERKDKTPNLTQEVPTKEEDDDKDDPYQKMTPFEQERFRAELIIKHLGNAPSFAKKVAEMKAKFGFTTEDEGNTQTKIEPPPTG